MKKKIVAVAVAVAFSAFAFVGCSQGTAEEKASDESAEVSTEAVNSAEAEAAEAADEQQAEDAAKPSANASSSKPAASNSSGSSASKPSSGSSSNGSSSGSSASKPQASAHEHSWVHHDAVYIENPILDEKVVCSCGQQFETTGEWSSHNQSLGFGNGHSYSVRDVQVGTQKELAEPEYWSCSCGATK